MFSFHRKKIENLALVEAYYKMGEIPGNAYNHILNTANFDVARIDEIEKTVNHDVIAF